MGYFQDSVAREDLRLKRMTVLLEVSKQLYKNNMITLAEYMDNLKNVYEELMNRRA